MSETEWIYDYIIQIIKSPEFRNPIKDFIDDNCGSFIGLDENTFQQSGLFNEFILLVEQMLGTALTDFGVTEEMFCLAAKRGLETKEDAKYFEQLIAFNNYLYFKNMMTKRNLQLEEMAYNEMRSKMDMSQSDVQHHHQQHQMIETTTMSSKTKEDETKGKTIVQTSQQQSSSTKEDDERMKKLEENELQAAIQMSMALEEEKRKLQALEEAELRKAIRFSYLQGENKMDKTAEPFIPKEIKHNIPIAKEEIIIKKEPEKKEPEKKEVKQSIEEEPPKKSMIVIEDKVKFPSLQPQRPKEVKKDEKINAIAPQNYIDKLIEKEKREKEKKKENEADDFKFEVGIKPIPSYPKFDPNEPQPKQAGKEELNNKIDQIEQEKSNKLKEYREMILKMKKDKRHEKEEKVEDDLIGDHELSEEVRKKLELRRQLAEKLKQSISKP